MTRVTDLATHHATLATMLRTQSQLVDLQGQVATGRKARDYSGVAAEATRLVNLKADYARVDRFLDNIKVVDLRLQQMESSVSSLFDLASRFKTLLLASANGDNAADTALAENARHMLDQVAGLLNQRQDGRYLFAGARTDTPPVDVDAIPAGLGPDEAGDGYYYRGDSDRLTVRVDDTLTVAYGVTADEPAFESLIRALAIAANTDVSDKDSVGPRIEAALGLIDDAIRDLPDVRSRIGQTRNTLELATGRHADFKQYAEVAIGDIEQVDIAEAITRLTAYENVLNASYAATVRLQRLSLTNFL